MSGRLLTEITNGRADIRLNRPDVHNAFDDQLIRELTETLEGLGQDPGVRVVVLAGEGKSFSAGGDLIWMRRFADYTFEQNLDDARELARLMHVLDSLPKPTIARVHGPAYGGGVGLVACCDIAVAAPAATFCLSEVKLGLIPSVISPYVMAAMGPRSARRYFLTAERFDAAEALRLGLVHELVPEEALDEAIAKWVAALLANGPEAMAAAKDLVHSFGQRPVDASLREDAARRIAERRASQEGKEGIAAFLDKRKPAWI